MDELRKAIAELIHEWDTDAGQAYSLFVDDENHDMQRTIENLRHQAHEMWGDEWNG